MFPAVNLPVNLTLHVGLTLSTKAQFSSNVILVLFLLNEHHDLRVNFTPFGFVIISMTAGFTLTHLYVVEWQVMVLGASLKFRWK